MKDNLKEGIDAAKAGNHADARRYLKKAINRNPNDSIAWLWLGCIEDDPQLQKDCMERVLEINPFNVDAQHHLRKLDPQHDAEKVMHVSYESFPTFPSTDTIDQNQDQQFSLSHSDFEKEDPINYIGEESGTGQKSQLPKFSVPLQKKNTLKLSQPKIPLDVQVVLSVIILIISISAAVWVIINAGDNVGALEEHALNSSAVQGIAARNLELWSTSPYRNERVENIQINGINANMQIIAEFRDSPESDWIEKQADVGCKKDSDIWQCDQEFSFHLTPSQLQKNTLKATNAAIAASTASTIEAEDAIFSKYSIANKAYEEQDWIRAAILFDEMYRNHPNYLDVSDKLRDAKDRSGRLIVVHNSEGTISELTWESETKLIFRLPEEVLSEQEIVISDDLSQIVYTSNNNEVRLIDKNGENDRLLIRFPRENFEFSSSTLSFSPSGNEILLMHKYLGIIDIGTRKFTALCEQKIDQDHAANDYASWSHAGDKVLVYEGGRLWVAASDGSDCTLIANISDYVGGFDFGTWSPDEKAIIWVSNDVLFSTSISNGVTEILTNNECIGVGYTWSQNQKYLALFDFSPGCGSIQIMDIENPGEILSIDARKYFTSLIWLP